MGTNWQCPFCGRHTTILDDRRSTGRHNIQIESKLGFQFLNTLAIACPNRDCRELYVVASMGPVSFEGPKQVPRYGTPHSVWTLRPQASVKVFPDYIPKPILEDYQEACLIRELSPKASATLSRRCLQGMIRDFHGITKARLVDEIEGLKGVVDSATWDAIDGLRKLGNIGAHMEKDINLVVEVDPDEAGLLIGLIENLIEDWYIARHDRELRVASIKNAAQAADQKKQQLKAAAATKATP